MTKICHVTSAHARYDDRIFYKECLSLASSGYDVTLLVADGLHNENRNDVCIQSIEKKHCGRFYRIINATKIMTNTALSIDAQIYHLHDPELLPLGVSLKKLGKISAFKFVKNVKIMKNVKKFFNSLLVSM